MLRYILKRVASTVVILFLIATVTFFMMRAIPGGPFTRDRALPPAVEAALNERFNLDAPLMEQYKDYMVNLVKLDLGPSFQKPGVHVNDIIAQGFPVSGKVGGIAAIAVIVLGVPLGIWAALKKNKFPDYMVSVISTLGITIPSFVIGTFMMYVFGERLGWIPAGGLSDWRSYIGPVIAIGGFSLAFVTRLTRSSMLEVTAQDYIRTARANGLSRGRIIFKHALKNALIPVVTYIGPMVASIMTGSFVVEKIFAIPGMGKYFVESITNRDYTVIMGTTIFYAVFYVIMVLFVDIAYAAIDPRIKLEQ